MQQPLARLLRELQSLFGELPAELLQKMIRQQQHVVPPFAQRRNRNRHGGNPEVQVIAKQLFLHLLLQIAVRGHHDSNVHVDRLRSPHPFESLFFQHPQQLRLNRQRQLANLVQKQRSAVRQIHFSHFARGRTRERALFVPKQLVFHQSFRDRRAIQCHKRLLPPRRQMMDRKGEQFFPRSAFAQ